MLCRCFDLVAQPVLLAAVLAPAEAVLVCCSVLFLSAMWFGLLVFSAVFPCWLWSAYVYALGCIVVLFLSRFYSAFAVGLSYIICCFQNKVMANLTEMTKTTMTVMTATVTTRLLTATTMKTITTIISW